MSLHWSYFPKKMNFPLFLKEIFASSSILGWMFFSFSSGKILCYILLASMVSDENFAVIQLSKSLCQKFFFVFSFQRLTLDRSLGMNLFEFNLSGVVLASWIFCRIWEVFSYYFVKYFLTIIFWLLSFKDFGNMMLDILLLSHRSLRNC